MGTEKIRAHRFFAESLVVPCQFAHDGRDQQGLEAIEDLLHCQVNAFRFR
jgi:hypothetical protein